MHAAAVLCSVHIARGAFCLFNRNITLFGVGGIVEKGFAAEIFMKERAQEWCVNSRCLDRAEVPRSVPESAWKNSNWKALDGSQDTFNIFSKQQNETLTHFWVECEGNHTQAITIEALAIVCSEHLWKVPQLYDGGVTFLRSPQS